jgi:predicted porin
MTRIHTHIPTRLAAAAVLFASAGSALAQSSVTIYGIVDSGVEYVTNVGTTGNNLVRVPTLTGTLPSRLGFRGSEDLGGGLRANFTLESGIAPDSGTFNQAGRAFGRQAFVGLSGDWGAVTFGRIYTMTFFALGGLDQLGPNVHSYGDMDGYLANARVDNAIGYKGTFSGVTVGATYSLGRDVAAAPAGAACAGEFANDRRSCRNVSAMLRYDAVNWGVALSGDRSHGGAGAAAGLTTSALTDTRTVAGGYWKFGRGTLGGGVILRNNEGAPAQPKSRLAFIGGTYELTPAVTLDLQYGKLDFQNSPNDSTYIAARAMYSFSKRTAVYASFGHISNEGTAAISVSGGAVAGAAPAPGGDQNGLMLGVRHSF